MAGGDSKRPAASAKPFQLSACAPWWVVINPLCWLLWILDALVWLISIILPLKTCSWCCRRCLTRHSTSNPDPETDDEDEDDTLRRRSKIQWDEGLLDGLDDGADIDQNYGAMSIWGIVERAFKEFKHNPCFGTRDYLGMDKSKGAPRRIFGETDWLTYNEVGVRAKAFGAGLRSLGLVPCTSQAESASSPGFSGLTCGALCKPDLAGPNETDLDSKPCSILIFEDTSASWLTALLGAARNSIVVATSYSTLGISSVGDAITQCNVSVTICNRKNVEEIAKSAPAVLKTIIYTDHYVSPEEKLKPPKVTGRIQVLSFEDVVLRGTANLAKYPPALPTPDRLAVIMYTSGSTGKPKGVMITHGNVVASVAGLTDILPVERGKETYVAHLPAAHIFEFCVELVMLTLGAKIGFADPRTLSSTGAVRQLEDGTWNEEAGFPNPPGAIQEFQPTTLVAVPVIWDTFRKKIEEEVGKKGILVQTLFQAAFSAQYFARKTGRTCPLLNLLVFRKFSQMLGGRLKFAASGGGPLNADVQMFISVVFGCSLVQGYALTETTCAGSAQDISDVDTGNVGGPLSSVEIKLRSCDGDEEPTDREGAPYLSTDDEHYGIPCRGRGEICIRGPSLSLGYFRQPDKTREVFDGEGWFHSGDIGYWDASGRLVIVDRLKNLLKLSGGEYIAIENMEKEYSGSAFVDGLKGGILCYGDGEMRRPVALVQVSLTELKKWARGQKFSESEVENVEALCAHPDAQAAILENLKACAKGRLGANEILVAVRLIPGIGPMDEATPTSPWTPENGCRTPSNKLDRKAIQRTCEKLMEELKAAGA